MHPRMHAHNVGSAEDSNRGQQQRTAAEDSSRGQQRRTAAENSKQPKTAHSREGAAWRMLAQTHAHARTYARTQQRTDGGDKGGAWAADTL